MPCVYKPHVYMGFVHCGGFFNVGLHLGTSSENQLYSKLKCSVCVLIIFVSCLTAAQLNTSNMLPEANATGTTTPPSTTSNFTCSTDFYLDPATGLCKPICGQWKLYPHATVVAIKVLVIFGAVACITIGVIIILTSALKYRHM